MNDSNYVEMPKKKIKYWAGWKKELPWIIFFIAMFFFIWTYVQDKRELDEVRNTQCYRLCAYNEAVNEIVKANPDLSIQCDYNTGTCNVAGWREPFGWSNNESA